MAQSHANQVKVVIDKPELRDLQYFAYYDQEALWEAMQKLTGAQFKMWIYLLANSPNVKWWISKEDTVAKTGISPKSYQRAMDVFEELGYIEKGKYFHMYPKEYGQNDYSQNDQDDMVILYDDYENNSQNDYRNKINTVNTTKSNNITKFLNTSVEEFEQPKGKDGNQCGWQGKFVF